MKGQLHSIFEVPEDRRKELEIRFWLKVEKTESCWLWRGFTNRYGKGQVGLWHDRKQGINMVAQAHRVAYEFIKGPLPNYGWWLEHACKNPACVNPEHLELIGRSAKIAQIKRRDVCPHGHLLVEGNLVVAALKKGHRVCLMCTRQTDNERKETKERQAYMTEYQKTRRERYNGFLERELATRIINQEFPQAVSLDYYRPDFWDRGNNRFIEFKRALPFKYGDWRFESRFFPSCFFSKRHNGKHRSIPIDEIFEKYPKPLLVIVVDMNEGKELARHLFE